VGPLPMDPVLERISTWEAAGLIDPATAARLRLAEAERQPEQLASSRRTGSSVASVFGPGVTIGEMFAYLGGTFLLGAYETFVVRLAGDGSRSELPIAIGSTVAATALALFATTLIRGDARRQRAAGVLLAVAVAHVGAAGAAFASAAGIGWPAAGVAGALVATIAAVGFRRIHASLLTQVALLASITSFAALLLSWLESVVVPRRSFDAEPLPQGGPDPILLVVVAAAWWLVLAVIVGLMGLREAADADEDAGAARRASLTRLWAGLLAVIGLASAVTRSNFNPSTGYSDRVVAPWLGELALLVLAAILVERAFRRDASVFVYAAALGLMIALSDFNFTYLSSSTEVGLLIEGVILLAAGVAADRLRRRIGQPEKEAELVSPTGAGVGVRDPTSR
jgi:hypothetical protein